MARFTISQLNTIPTLTYNLLDSDLIMASIGSDTYNLSSVRLTLRDLGDYFASTYATNNTLAVAGPLSAQLGLSANGVKAHPINFAGLPVTTTGLQAGDLFTQTKAEILGTGSSTQKILCVMT